MRRIPVALVAIPLLVRCLPPELSGAPTSGGTGSLVDPGGGSTSAHSFGGTGTSATPGGTNAGDESSSVAGGDSAAGSYSEVTGGETGVGGETTLPQGTPDIIDDMEDGDAQITLSDGRNGFWFVGNDGTPGGTQSPALGGFAMADLPVGERSAYAAHTKASGFTGWGATIGFNFVEQVGVVKPYDATPACGIRFVAKAAAATSVRVLFADANTHPAGQVCTDPGDAAHACFDDFSLTVALTTQWKEYFVAFSDLKQLGTGYHPVDQKVRANALYSLSWRLPGSAQAHEIWLDDLSFALPPTGNCN